MPHQLDLGAAWKELTGLPFVFAAWVAAPGFSLPGLSARLERAKREGLDQVSRIVERDAVPRGWPADLARRYLTEYLRYDMGPRQVQAIERFHREAHALKLLPGPLRPILAYAEV
jgi:predicted solute-binding protein